CYAQDGMTKEAPNAKEMATLRDTALNIIKAVEGDNVKEAAALAAKLSPKPKADPGAKLERVPLNKHLIFEGVMHQFSSKRIGGYGIEGMLDEMVESKDPFKKEEIEALVPIGYRLLMIGTLSDAYADSVVKAGDKKKTAAAWKVQTEQFRKTTVGLIEAAKSKNAANTREALEKVTKACTSCHKIFRDED